MPFLLAAGALQVASAIPDTIVTLTLPAERSAFEWISGTLQLVVLLLGVWALSSLALVALGLRKSVHALQETVERISREASPLLTQATVVAQDARALVASVKVESDRLADATRSVSKGIRYAADSWTHRLDEVNAVLDVLQDEFEHAALSSASTLRGLRVGIAALTRGTTEEDREALRRRKKRRRKRRRPAPPTD